MCIPGSLPADGTASLHASKVTRSPPNSVPCPPHVPTHLVVSSTAQPHKERICLGHSPTIPLFFSSACFLWQVRRLRESGKVVVASVCNVAASGGYYIAMGCETIVCDELSITGSIGVVQAKFAAGEFLDKVIVLVVGLYFSCMFGVIPL